MKTKAKQYLLVEPIAKTHIPPLGLMKIASMLKKRGGAQIFSQVGDDLPKGLALPEEIFITSLFTWDIDKVITSVNHFQRRFPKAKIHIGGIAATLLPEHVYKKTGVKPHIGLLEKAEIFPPDYTHTFGRTINSSITFASRGCPRKCKFCNVSIHEPNFYEKDSWTKDVDPSLPRITFFDNNWLASANIEADCEKLKKYGKWVDFNQGLDARLFTEDKAKVLLEHVKVDPIRFAFDSVGQEKYVLNAIKLARKYSGREICVYVLYNFKDTPEDFFYRINLLNREKVLSFPMEYREATPEKRRMPGRHWNTAFLRAMKLSLLFYYRKGMITEKRSSFLSIYGKSSSEFINRLSKIYNYDKALRRKEEGVKNGR